MANNAVTTSQLFVRRGRAEVLRHIDIEVPNGQVVGLLGPSGSGKTTLLRSIVGSQRITAGSVSVLGHPAGSRALRHQVGYMGQTPSIYDDLTVEQNLRYFASVLGAPKGDVARVLGAVDLTDCAQTLVALLSGGQCSRVSLAIALLGAPQLLVLDEPTVGLDPLLRRDLWDLFARLAAHGTALLISSHVMDEARRCDRLILLRAGQVIADDSPDGILRATGAKDHDEAFLILVERQGQGQGQGQGQAS